MDPTTFPGPKRTSNHCMTWAGRKSGIGRASGFGGSMALVAILWELIVGEYVTKLITIEVRRASIRFSGITARRSLALLAPFSSSKAWRRNT